MHDNPVMAWLGIAALFIAAVAAAQLLRACRAPGWSVLGGICAGLLVGSTFLGRLNPDLYTKLCVGGAAERQQLLALTAYQQSAATSPDREQIAHDAVLNAQRAYAGAQRDFQSPLRIIALCVTAIVLFSAVAGPRSEPHPDQHTMHALSIGAWAALLPGGLLFILFYGPLGVSLGPALIASAAVAIGPWALTRADRDAADFAEHGGARLLHNAGIVSTALAVAALLYGITKSTNPEALIYMLPLAGLAITWLIPTLGIPWLLPAVHLVLLPALAAFATVHLDLFEHFAFWPMCLVIILSGDGRWFGAFLGAMMLGGRSGLRTMRLVMGSMACGPTQLAIAVIALAADALPPQYILPIVLGAALVEAVAPLRRRMAVRLLQTEMEIDELMKDS